MNKEWSDLNKIMQWQIKKRDNYSLGIETLIELRKLLMEQILQFKNGLEEPDFSAMPFMNVNGYHNKTIAYWLIDYWCGKDIRGLIQMPLSRHWIMHLEACLRIRSKLG